MYWMVVRFSGSSASKSMSASMLPSLWLYRPFITGLNGAGLALLRLLGGTHLGSREYLFRHYDSEVQARTWLRPGEGDACVLRVARDRSLGVAHATEEFAVSIDSVQRSSIANLATALGVERRLIDHEQCALTGSEALRLTLCSDDRLDRCALDEPFVADEERFADATQHLFVARRRGSMIGKLGLLAASAALTLLCECRVEPSAIDGNP